MNRVLLLDFVIIVFGIANGMLVTATPQAALALHLSSQDLGMIGAGNPLGYGLSCLLFGRIFAKYPGKWVLIGGTLATVCSMLAMASARSAGACVAAQIGFGVASGAFWPFASAWMLDFQSEEMSKIRLLRHYNLSWTSGTAVGMYCGGLFSAQGWIFETFVIGAGLTALSMIAALLVPAKRRAEDGVEPARSGVVIGLAMLSAAVLANLISLSARSIVLNNYAELNQLQGFSADRMGIVAAGAIVSELAGFMLGHVYERWLGLRRLYVFIAVSLIAILLVFAYSTNMALLLPAVFLQGIVLAVAFQVGIVAATEYFSAARTGTTFHEAIVGFGGMTPVAAGAIVAAAKSGGSDAIPALRLPFFLLAGAIGGVLLLQLILLSRQTGRRALLHPASQFPVSAD